MDGVNSQGFKIIKCRETKWWIPHAMLCIPPHPTLYSSVNPGNLGKFTWSEITRKRTLILKQSEIVITVFTSSLAWVLWIILCVHSEFGVKLRFVPWDCNILWGLILPKCVGCLTNILVAPGWGMRLTGPWRHVRTPAHHSVGGDTKCPFHSTQRRLLWKMIWAQLSVLPLAPHLVFQVEMCWLASNIHSYLLNYSKILRVGWKQFTNMTYFHLPELAKKKNLK